MNIEDIREYCIAKEGVEECFPFDEDTLVFKVYGKMFVLVSISEIPLRFNVKCDPERAIALREQYENIASGFHMNHKHWNTVTVDNIMGRKMLLEQIDHSYSLVAKKPKKK